MRSVTQYAHAISHPVVGQIWRPALSDRPCPPICSEIMDSVARNSRGGGQRRESERQDAFVVMLPAGDAPGLCGRCPPERVTLMGGIKRLGLWDKSEVAGAPTGHIICGGVCDG